VAPKSKTTTKTPPKTETEVTCKDFNPGTVVCEPGSAASYHTGGWRSQKPITDKSKCSKCGLCFLYCPEGCIIIDEQGLFSAGLDYCKGCGICAKECPRKCIVMIQEEEA
jgi:pyruvate ferredoxin oxidoreductase delta subunit